MRRTTLVSVLAVLALSGLGPARAGPAYTANDIVKHFSPDGGGDARFGRTRGLCVGTHSECNAGTEARKPTGNFDLVVNFELNSDTLTPGAKANLDEFARALQDARLKSASFVVEGHTDGRGSDDFNVTLSARRANAVVQYLAARGVQPKQLAAKGYGKARPLASDPLDPANRRVETRLATE
ncbi:OmpA family protein [Methylobacterium crusticola]|nr:OmpA family protein [Methylobacterium crusticola]